MTTTKANIGALSAPVNIVLGYLLVQIPFVAEMPGEVQTALVMMVASAMTWAFVYFAPANTA